MHARTHTQSCSPLYSGGSHKPYRANFRQACVISVKSGKCQNEDLLPIVQHLSKSVDATRSVWAGCTKRVLSLLAAWVTPSTQGREGLRMVSDVRALVADP